ADNIRKPLRLYGILEIGIALFAVVFVLLANAYPSLYVALAKGKNDHIYLTVIRVVFSVVALILPTTLMGGTLPVLSRFLSRQPDKVRGYLSFLYGFNTLGAVTGAAAAGFYFLRFYSVSLTLTTAIVMNLAIGLISIVMQEKGARIFARDEEIPASALPESSSKPTPAEKAPANLFS
ncbi:spermidine synthase, partial [Candidatus Saccharibacteria bacterium]|nr:spermidine synthase [Candidatus Saccharibacteria bacterium]